MRRPVDSAKADYGRTLRARRILLGLSQDELAERADVAQGSLSRLEAGIYSVSEHVRRAVEEELARLEQTHTSAAAVRGALSATRDALTGAVSGCLERLDALSLELEGVLQRELQTHKALGDLVAEVGEDGRPLTTAERVALLVAEYDSLQADYDAVVGGAA